MNPKEKEKKMKLRGFNILTNPNIPKDIGYFIDENNFGFRRPRKLPRYTFQLFGRLIKIYIEEL